MPPELNKLNNFIADFKNSAIWQEMLATVENSPYHREANVAVHTQMTLDAYQNTFAQDRTDQEQKITMIALLFHDIGKPSSEEEVIRTDGSVYRRYAGHEQVSAVGFVEYYAANEAIREFVTPIEAHAIRWIIEHHLPYSLGAPKHQLLIQTLSHLCHEIGVSTRVFYDHLCSDTLGRNSDNDHYSDVKEWCYKSSLLEVKNVEVKLGGPKDAYILAGPSGSGKSTFVKQFESLNPAVLNLDQLRIEYYKQNNEVDTNNFNALYNAAWSYCNDNADYSKFVQSRYAELIATGARYVFDDNTNLSKKRRAQNIQMLRKAGYTIHGVEFWVTKADLIARQNLRDKQVPVSAILQQRASFQAFNIGTEVDSIIVWPFMNGK